MIMIAFVMVYTWYFSLAISYKIGITERGDIELTSFRRVIRVNAEVIGMVEGPKWAIIPYGFVRFRLEREKAYIFCCITDADFEQYMQIMKAANPEMILKGSIKKIPNLKHQNTNKSQITIFNDQNIHDRYIAIASQF